MKKETRLGAMVALLVWCVTVWFAVSKGLFNA